MVNPPDMVESSSSKRVQWTTEGAELTGVVDGTGAQRRRRCDLSWSGSTSGTLRSSQTYARGERWGEAAWHRQSGGKQRRCSGDGLPEEGNGGARTKCTGKVLFYRRALHGGNAACTEGEPKVMARHGGRAMGVHARGEMGQLGPVQRRGTHAGCIPQRGCQR
jgi:hypothetical protein